MIRSIIDLTGKKKKKICRSWLWGSPIRPLRDASSLWSSIRSVRWLITSSRASKSQRKQGGCFRIEIRWLCDWFDGLEGQIGSSSFLWGGSGWKDRIKIEVGGRDGEVTKVLRRFSERGYLDHTSDSSLMWCTDVLFEYRSDSNVIPFELCTKPEKVRFWGSKTFGQTSR